MACRRRPLANHDELAKITDAQNRIIVQRLNEAGTWARPRSPRPLGRPEAVKGGAGGLRGARRRRTPSPSVSRCGDPRLVHYVDDPAGDRPRLTGARRSRDPTDRGGR